jgi:hypothetical protein
MALDERIILSKSPPMPRIALVFLLAAMAAWPCARAAETTNDAFLEDLEHRGFDYFHKLADPATGFVPDRAPANGRPAPPRSSIAATGFGLTALCIGVEHGWITRAEGQASAERTLAFLWEKMPQEHGFFYHWVNSGTGARLGTCELSSIDTALLLNGVLTVRAYFKGTPAEPLATQIYNRVDWPWMTDGQSTLSMGWHPENGFIKYHWSQFSEHLGMDLLAIGSPTHPLPAASWNAWKRQPLATFEGHNFLQCPPLFTHQYPQAWVDFRGWRDGQWDYFANARTATLAQRAFCVGLHEHFPKYQENIWGLTASASANGYTAWGGPPPIGRQPDPRIDGTVVPCAPGGSIPFAPQECIAALRAMREEFGDRIYGPYGFADAFHPTNGWTSDQVLGIDVGITLLMAENYRTGLVWRYFMQNPEITTAMNLAGLKQVKTDSTERNPGSAFSLTDLQPPTSAIRR